MTRTGVIIIAFTIALALLTAILIMAQFGAPLPLDEIEIEYKVEPEQPEREQEPTYFNIVLSRELQSYTMKICAAYGVPYRLALSVMFAESSYRADVVNGQSYGLMQIHKINFNRLFAELGITDFLEPKSNIRAGVYMLAELLNEHGDTHKALMAYNHGEAGARKLWQQGITESAYSRKVINYMEGLKCKENNSITKT